jgi:hypothetical protein
MRPMPGSASNAALEDMYRNAGFDPGMPPLPSIVDEAMGQRELAPMPEYSGALPFRRRIARCINHVLHNNFAYLVEEMLRTRYHWKTYAEMALQSGISTRHNPMIDAVDRLNVAVWPSSTRSLFDTKTGEPVEDPRFDNENQQIAWDPLANNIAYLLWVQKAVCVIPRVMLIERTNERKIVHVVLTPDVFNLVACKGAPGEWEALQLFHGPQANGMELMTEEWSTVIKYYERRTSRDGEEEQAWRLIREEPNDLGVVNAVIFRRRGEQIWSTNYGEKLLESTLEVNAAQTMSTFKSTTQIKMFQGDGSQMGAGIRLRQGMMIDAGQQGILNVVDLQTDEASFKETYIQDELRDAAISLGLPVDIFEKTALLPPSGEAMRLKYADRQQRAQEMREAVIPSMVALRWLTLHVLHYAITHSVSRDGTPLPPVSGFPNVASLAPYAPGKPIAEQPVKLVIDVADLDLPETQAERAARQEYDAAKGFKTWPQMMLEENPDLGSVETAEELIKQNHAENAELTATKVRSMVPMRPTPPPPVKAAPEASDVEGDGQGTEEADMDEPG